MNEKTGFQLAIYNCQEQERPGKSVSSKSGKSIRRFSGAAKKKAQSQ